MNDANNKDSLRQDRYETEIEGVSMNTLEAGLWWVKNRRKLWLTLIISLIVISAVSWGYSFFGLGAYLLSGMNSDSQMVKDLVQTKTVTQNYLLAAAAKNLIYSSTGIVSNDGKYDLYAQVKNPNAKYWGEFSYCFTTAAGEKSCGKDFILPGDKKYVLSLAQAFKNWPSSVTFLAKDIVWHKIDNHLIPDWNKYRDDHLNISVKNVVFTPAATNEISEKIGLNTLSFTAVNNSAFGYWEAPFTIVLSNSGKISSINSYVIKKFISYDSQDVKITWPGIIGAIDSTIITPDINIMDGGNYQQPNE